MFTGKDETGSDEPCAKVASSNADGFPVNEIDLCVNLNCSGFEACSCHLAAW